MGTTCSSENGSLSLEHVMQRQKHFKIIILGDEGVGKTSVFNRIKHNRFSGKYVPTFEKQIATICQKINLPEDMIVSLSIWDTPSKEEVDLRHIYYEHCDAAIVVVDITDRRSVESAQFWKSHYLSNSESSDKPVFLLGNKYDLIEERLKASKMSAACLDDLDAQRCLERNNLDITDRQISEKYAHSSIKLLHSFSLEHRFTGSMLISCRDPYLGDPSTAMSAIVRRLLTSNLKGRGVNLDNSKDDPLDIVDGDVAEVDENVAEDHISEQGRLRKNNAAVIQKMSDYAEYLSLTTKRFRQCCADEHVITESKASLEDCVVGLKSLMTEYDLELKLQDEDGFPHLLHGNENVRKYEIPLIFSAIFRTYNKELGTICRAILRDVPCLQADYISNSESLKLSLTRDIQALSGYGDNEGADCKDLSEAELRQNIVDVNKEIKYQLQRLQDLHQSVNIIKTKTEIALMW